MVDTGCISERPLRKLSCLLTAPQLLPGSERECGHHHPCCVQLLGTELAASRLAGGGGREDGTQWGGRGDWLRSRDWAGKPSSPHQGLPQAAQSLGGGFRK